MQALEPFQADVGEVARGHDVFRAVLFTGEHSQLVVMSLRPGEDIGDEVHDVDQLFYFVEGTGETVLDGRSSVLEKGQVLVVPSGTRHNIRNNGLGPMKLLTIYAPPQHAAGTIHRTKAEAMAEEEHPEVQVR